MPVVMTRQREEHLCRIKANYPEFMTCDLSAIYSPWRKRWLVIHSSKLRFLIEFLRGVFVYIMNLQMLLFKAFAIVDVVLRHRYWPFSDFMFIASSIPLFLFLSGYFYKSSAEQEPLLFIVKKFKRLILLYFAYNAVYALITYFIYVKYGSLLGHLPTWRNFFIQPFIDGQQYSLSAPMWFIPFFFTVQIFYMFTSKFIRKFTADEYAHLLIFAGIGLGAVYLRNLTSEPDALPFACLALRILYGMLFISLGRCFAQKFEQYSIYQLKLLVLAIGVRLILFISFKEPCYSFANAGFDNLCSLFYSIIDIYFLLYLSKYLGGFIKPDNFMYKIGNNTFHIMANHMLVFYIFDTVLTTLSGQDPAVPANPIWKYTWLVYLIFGVIIPTCLGMLFKYLRKKAEKTLEKQFPILVRGCDKLAEYKLNLF